MDLAPKDYLLIWAVIVTAVVIPFYFRKRDRPTPLNLDGSPATSTKTSNAATRPEGQGQTSTSEIAGGPRPASRSGAKAVGAGAAGPTRLEYRPRAKSPPAKPGEPWPEPIVEKSLNVFFQWNGHAWDAYEALGLPAGSSLESVRLAYQKLVTQSKPDDLQFFKAAFEAVVRTRPPS